MAVAGVILAGGAGARFQGDVNKVLVRVGGRPILQYSIETFQRCLAIDRIVVVAREQEQTEITGLISDLVANKEVVVVGGGLTRQQSELAALEALSSAISSDEVDLVAIHDGARPFATSDLCEAVVGAARLHGGAVPGHPVPTPLIERREGGYSVVEGLWSVQTPQAFTAKPLLAAYRSAQQDGFEGADTAETVARYSDLKVVMVDGGPDNMKITVAEDLVGAEELAASWHDGGV